MDGLIKFVCSNTVDRGQFKAGQHFISAAFGHCEVLTVRSDHIDHQLDRLQWQPFFLRKVPRRNELGFAMIFEIMFADDYEDGRITRYNGKGDCPVCKDRGNYPHEA